MVLFILKTSTRLPLGRVLDRNKLQEGHPIQVAARHVENPAIKNVHKPEALWGLFPATKVH